MSFAILLYQAEDGNQDGLDNPGLKFSMDFNLGALNMLNLGDVINDMVYPDPSLRDYSGRNRPGD